MARVNIPGIGAVNFPEGMTPEEINASVLELVKTRQDGAGGAQAGAATPTPAGAPAPLTGLEKPSNAEIERRRQAWPVPLKIGVEGLGDAVRTVGRDEGFYQNPLQGLKSGGQATAYRAARGVGLPQTLAYLGLGDKDTEAMQAALDAQRETAPLGTTGDVITSGALGMIAPAVVGRNLPASVANFAAKHPYLAGAGATTATTAALTPGGITERAIPAAISGVGSLPFTLAARTVAKPLQMSDAGKDYQIATGRVPPVHLGAESAAVRQVGDLSKSIPFTGRAVQAGEDVATGKIFTELGGRATPPAWPPKIDPKTGELVKQHNLISDVGHNVKRGETFVELENQYEPIYNGLFKGRTFILDKTDKANLATAANRLDPREAGALHAEISNMINPMKNRFSGEHWKDIQSKIRFKASEYGSSLDPAQREIGAAYRELDSVLAAARNRSLPPNYVKAADDTDKAWNMYATIRDSIRQSGGAEGLTMKQLMKTIEERGTSSQVAKQTVPGQDVVEAASVLIPHKPAGEIASALWRGSRLASAASPYIAGAVTGGPGALLPLTLGGLYGVGATQAGAKALFGQTVAQRRLQDFMQQRPMDMAARTAGTIYGLTPQRE